MALTRAFTFCLRAGVIAATRAAGMALAVLVMGAGLDTACADPVKGVATLTKPGDYARLLIKLDEDVESEVKVSGSILIVHFKKPVNVPVMRLPDQAPDYIASARRDPDGSAIRFALTRRIKVNTMAAGERLFIDLLPENWSGMPPGLPQEVVQELAERARAAEKVLRQQRQATEAKKQAPVRVRASTQPTFARYVFEIPEGVGVSSELGREKLTLLFDAALTFDLADAQVIAPPNVAAIEQKNDAASTTIEMNLIGDVNVHSFREDRNFVVDVGFSAAQKAAAARDNARLNSPPPPAVPSRAKPETPAPSQTPAPSLSAPESPPPVPRVEAPPPPPADKAAAMPVAPPPPPPVEQVVAAPPADPVPPPAKTDAPAVRAAAPPDAAPPPASTVDALAVEVKRDSSGLRLIVPYRAPIPAALFARADTLWFVVDSATPLAFDAVRAQAASLIRDVTAHPLSSGAQAVRLRLERPQLASLAQADQGWVLSFADTAQAPSQQLTVLRNIADPARANVTIPFDQPSKLHRFTDPDSGDPLLVITALAPARGFIKKQDFVEFRLLQSVHGVVVEPNSDDVGVELAGDKILIGRPGGLTLSAAEMTPDRAPQAMRPMFDLDSWRDNVKAEFVPREHMLLNAAAQAPDEKRFAARLDLARFYFAKGFYVEAKGVLDTVLADMRQGQEDATALVMRALARILINRPGEALKDLAHPVIGSNYDSQLWKAIALARQEKWAEAREKFKNVEFSVSALPVELQRIAVIDALRAMLAVRDYAGASAKVNELEIIGLGDEQRAEVAVLRGRLAEALGRDADASAEYREAIKSADRRAGAEATLHDLALRQRRGEIKPDELLDGLETLAVIWRGDAIEVGTLQQLAQFYAEQGRYRDALMAVRTATTLLPNAEATRAMQSAASSWFGDVFLGTKGDDLPPIEALAMFYEFRELTPIGRRGDEMIRRLADRLAAIDLLDQASQLLQYQVDHRLEGAARAQVASRLATFYLMNRKPERAVAALRSSRIAELAGELRQQRLLLEARAQSDLGRHDLALDIISNLSGRETVRLRADIHWAARRWRDSAEQIEVLYGERWRDFQPLKSGEKSDIMRAAIGYALAEDGLGIARLREKYGPLMADEADRKAFDIATRPVAATSSEFAEIARMAASVDTLEGFLREMKTRFPDVTAKAAAPAAPKADPVTTGSLPVIPGLKSAVKAR